MGRQQLEQECASRADAGEWTDNMEDPRDVQTSKRNGSFTSLLSPGSAVAMEIKRKKIRQSALFVQTEVWAQIKQNYFVRFVVNTGSQWQLTQDGVQSATVLVQTS